MGVADSGDMVPECVAQIAAELGLAPADVMAMNRRMAGADLSLNTALSEALAGLGSRERRILVERQLSEEP